ncbi:hypothetical protein SAMN04488109_6032 [Chryseolinea serpens]|uniref:Uncharacterized protein n=1 Tax=Chryseolinea serpens TaxID=947013 RepID=A0A1M5WU90_9BACT|nr:hypothetical protein [Chryseolinea serpens]SHH91159.1 hypothetical protein SAMN04488109_6032 [Chryseolinea serpens]
MQAKISDALLENISVVQDEIILNGAPRSLRGKITLHNKNESIARVRSINLMAPDHADLESGLGAALRINSKLLPGETRVEHVSVSLTPDTPPGTYDTYVSIGGKNTKVKIVVQPTIAIEAEPKTFTFQGTAPDTIHTATITLTNIGNLPFQIPQITHVAPLDMDMLCRALGVGFRKNKDDGFTQTMDHITQNIKNNLPAWANASVAEAGQILSPGQSMLVHLNVTMPPESNAGNDYELLIRLWDIDLSLVIKSHVEPKKPKRNGQ